MPHFDNALIALAHPSRRKIIESLSSGEKRVTDIAKNLPISLNSVSKHIRLLERAKIVERKIKGREHYLKLRIEVVEDVKDRIDKYIQACNKKSDTPA